MLYIGEKNEKTDLRGPAYTGIALLKLHMGGSGALFGFNLFSIGHHAADEPSQQEHAQGGHQFIGKLISQSIHSGIHQPRNHTCLFGKLQSAAVEYRQQ